MLYILCTIFIKLSSIYIKAYKQGRQFWKKAVDNSHFPCYTVFINEEKEDGRVMTHGFFIPKMTDGMMCMCRMRTFCIARSA